MIRKVSDIIKYLTANPKNLFLIDSLGAMLTTFFLFFVLRNLNEHFGMPVSTLNYLVVIASCFFIYSTACFYFLNENWTPFIRAIGIANLLYCVLTLGLVFVYWPILTIIGITYFLVEVILVLWLVYIELNVVTTIKKKQARKT